MKPEPVPPDQTRIPEPATGRPRDRRIDEAVLDAAGALLVEVGYARLTLGAIAKRAGTTTPAIYRRWPSKAHLVHEVAIPSDYTALPPSTGDLRADLRTLAAGASALFGTPVARAAFPGLLTEIAGHPELHERLLERFQSGIFTGLRQRIAAAVDAGELSPAVDADRILELIAGAAVVRLMLRPHLPIDDGWTDQIVDLVMHGIGPNPA